MNPLARSAVSVLAAVGLLGIASCIDVEGETDKFCRENPEICAGDAGVPDGGSDGACDAGAACNPCDAGDACDAGVAGLDGGPWVPTQPMHEARYLHTATRLPNGKVLVVGGFRTPSEATATTEIYDPNDGVWSDAGSLPEPRAAHTATVLDGGNVLIVGGRNQGGALETAMLYRHEDGGSWEAAGEFEDARSHHAAVLLSSGEVLVMGGATTEDKDGHRSVVQYDPSDGGSWSVKGSLKETRNNFSATTLVDGRVLAVGGIEAGLRGAELYQPIPQGWVLVSQRMAVNRVGHTVTLLESGEVLVAGVDLDGGSVSTSTELFNPHGETWRNAGSLNGPRAYHTATRLLTNDVLVAGGTPNGHSPLSSVQLYRPTDGGWTEVPGMREARYRHQATLLENGEVLVTGGRDDAGTPLSSTEKYVP